MLSPVSFNQIGFSITSYKMFLDGIVSKQKFEVHLESTVEQLHLIITLEGVH